MLKLENIVAGYGHITALKDISQHLVKYYLKAKILLVIKHIKLYMVVFL